VHGFNLAGYYLLFNYFQKSASHQMISQIGRGEYAVQDLVEVKIAYPLAYASTHTLVEKNNGEIEVGGITYNYVSLNLNDDTLRMVCIPNTEKSKVNASRNDFAGQFSSSDNSTQGKKSSGSIQKAFSAEYSNTAAFAELTIPSSDVQLHGITTGENSCTEYFATPGQPPQLA
jgi:uncharacterized membrane protein